MSHVKSSHTIKWYFWYKYLINSMSWLKYMKYIYIAIFRPPETILALLALPSCSNTSPDIGLCYYGEPYLYDSYNIKKKLLATFKTIRTILKKPIGYKKHTKEMNLSWWDIERQKYFMCNFSIFHGALHSNCLVFQRFIMFVMDTWNGKQRQDN